MIKQWSDPRDGIIGVTLKCDAPSAASSPLSSTVVRLHVPEVALLCVGARQLVRPLLRRHDDPLLTQ